MYVCLSVCAIFMYVEVEVRGQHLVLFSGTIPLFFFYFILEMEPLAVLTGFWDFMDSVRLMGQQYLGLYQSLPLSTKITSL